jgi:hypothetical protein
MSTVQNVNNIVTNGLVMYLDAANTRSYPGTGTTWTDLSQYKSNGTLTNGPTFSSSNIGSIVFDGVDDYSDFGNKTLGVELQDRAACVWIYQTKNPIGVSSIIDKDYDFGGSNYGGWGFWITQSNKMNFWAHSVKDLTDTGTSITNNIWQHISFSYNFTTKTASFYLNGILNSTVSNLTIEEKISDTTTLKIGAMRGGANFFGGRIAIAKIYNRALTATEILQNYNATKLRFI